MLRVTAGLRAIFSGKASGVFRLTDDRHISYRNLPVLKAAALVFARNFLSTVVIGLAMLLQGPDGGLRNLVGLSWGLKITLMCGLGLALNFRKLKAFCLALEATFRPRTMDALSDVILSPATV